MTILEFADKVGYDLNNFTDWQKEILVKYQDTIENDKEVYIVRSRGCNRRQLLDLVDNYTLYKLLEGRK